MNRALNNIRVVLYEPSHPGNVGSVIRAMETMGLSHLYLVRPKKFPDPQIEALASGAQRVFQHLKVTENLEEAIGDCGFIIGTSARPRDLGITRATFKESGSICAKYAQDNVVALLFGPERTGLTNELLMRCHLHAYIPTSENYPSLNLAAAVQVMCYEIRQVLEAEKGFVPDIPNELAEFSELERFYEHLEQVLIRVKFLNAENPRRLMQKFRRLFNRAQVEKNELNILRGFLSAIEKQPPTNS